MTARGIPGIPGTWRGRPPEVGVLIVMLLFGSMLNLVALLRPGHPEAPLILLGISVLLGPVLALMLWWPGSRFLTARLHTAAIIRLGAAYALVATAATGEGAMASAIVTVWMALYTAGFHSQRVARRYLAGMSVALAAAMVVNPVIERWLGPWLAVAVSAAVASEVIGHVLTRTRELAVTDHLTGLPNRLGLYRRFEQEVRAAERDGESLALAMIDLDGFKLLNDRDGHAAGDRMLVDITREISDRVRGRDCLFRTGGDEFLLLLPATTESQAAQLMARLHADSVATWSYGIGVVAPGESLDLTLARADHHMYVHKEDRRSGGPRQQPTNA